MKIKIEASKNEKQFMLIAAIVILFFVYWYNKRYLYIMDAEFDNGEASTITLKTGFLFPKKSIIELKDNFIKNIGFPYFYEARVSKTSDGYDLLINKKKVYSIKDLSYYETTKKTPTGRISL